MFTSLFKAGYLLWMVAGSTSSLFENCSIHFHNDIRFTLLDLPVMQIFPHLTSFDFSTEAISVVMNRCLSGTLFTLSASIPFKSKAKNRPTPNLPKRKNS
jgi:hypothetical protein